MKDPMSEDIDVLVVSAAAGLELPKSIVEILNEVRTSVLIFRSHTQGIYQGEKKY